MIVTSRGGVLGRKDDWCRCSFFCSLFSDMHKCRIKIHIIKIMAVYMRPTQPGLLCVFVESHSGVVRTAANDRSPLIYSCLSLLCDVIRSKAIGLVSSCSGPSRRAVGWDLDRLVTGRIAMDSAVE